MTSLLFVAATVCAGLGLTACGGPSDPPPGPLSNHFQDTFLAQIPLDQRKDEIAAKQAYDIAVLEQAKAEADLNESRTQLDVAKNERDSAALDEKSAASRQAAAKSSADLNRMKEADKELDGAKQAHAAADQRYKYLVAYRDWLKRLFRYTQENTYWKEAQYELAQARLAQKNSIQPAGFNFDNFVRQEAQRAQRTTTAKSKADREREAAEGARQKWLALQGQADKTLGKKSQFPDPMAPKQVKGVDQSMGAGGYTVGGSGTSSDGEVQPVQDPTRDSDDDGSSGNP
ncbi:MAG: hypothetical protein KC464_15615 [Myxococcales bacterium]|nr:hypothetical protein [Myxococcales bacterium]